MADCINNCTSGSKEHVEIDLKTVSEPPPTLWGDTVKVGIDVISKSLIIPDTVVVDLWDITRGECLDSTGAFHLGLSETKRIILNAGNMPNGNLNLRVSVAAFWGTFWNVWQCQDSYAITVRGIDPSATHLVCSSKTKLCVPVPGAGANLDGCNFVGDPCGEVDIGAGITEPVVCSTNDMNVMGICVPKPVVLGIFALGAIYIFKSS